MQLRLGNRKRAGQDPPPYAAQAARAQISSGADQSGAAPRRNSPRCAGAAFVSRHSAACASIYVARSSQSAGIPRSRSRRSRVSARRSLRRPAPATAARPPAAAGARHGAELRVDALELEAVLVVVAREHALPLASAATAYSSVAASRAQLRDLGVCVRSCSTTTAGVSAEPPGRRLPPTRASGSRGGAPARAGGPPPPAPARAAPSPRAPGRRRRATPGRRTRRPSVRVEWARRERWRREWRCALALCTPLRGSGCTRPRSRRTTLAEACGRTCRARWAPAQFSRGPWSSGARAQAVAMLSRVSF